MTSALEHLKWASITAAAFLMSLAANEWLFTQSELVRGVNWIYLPAGVRLLATLLFGFAGATGLLVASWIACFVYFFPDDFVRSAVGGVIATVAPLGAYFLANEILGLGKNLRNLTPTGLLVCTVLYALLNSTLHFAWAYLSAVPPPALESLIAMFIGDASGALLVCYIVKGLLYVVQRQLSKSSPGSR
ncbi:hypothetical protein N7373_20280 [Achromobacter mucicolens]|nr:hypothetical protein [Achromobacter mucicolens]MDH0093793.1 hypothetical protein [Achromobacter mucicolens]